MTCGMNLQTSGYKECKHALPIGEYCPDCKIDSLEQAIMDLRKAFYVDGKPAALRAAFEKTLPLIEHLRNK